MTAIANYQPFQDPQGGPNFYQFDQDALYEIHFDSNGDAKEDLTFQFRFTNALKGTALSIGGQSVPIPLIQSGGVSAQDTSKLNVNETFTVDVVRNDRRSGTRVGKLTNVSGGSSTFTKPVDNIGDKTFGSATGYETYANQYIYNVAIPGCTDQGKLFVGQRKEPFFIAVGKIFDVVNLNPVGPETDPASGNRNDLEGKTSDAGSWNYRSAVSIRRHLTTRWSAPDDRKRSPGTPSQQGTVGHEQRRQERRCMDAGLTARHAAGQRGGYRHSRQGPVQCGQADRRLGASQVRAVPDAAGDYRRTVRAAAPAPTKFPRTDLVAAFLTGIQGVNQPKNVIASEMMRLNTAIAPTAQASRCRWAYSLVTMPASRMVGARATTSWTLRCEWRWVRFATRPSSRQILTR